MCHLAVYDFFYFCFLFIFQNYTNLVTDISQSTIKVNYSVLIFLANFNQIKSLTKVATNENKI